MTKKNRGSQNSSSRAAKTDTNETPTPSSHRPRKPDRPLFFFGPSNEYGEFSQWYRTSFTVGKAEIADLLGHSVDDAEPKQVDPVPFSCAEQFMMYCKAGRFKDFETQKLILQTMSPKEQKSLGRSVVGFEDASWDEVKSEVVLMGNLAKFRRSKDLRKLLLDTGDRLLVEAASNDRVWGIGFNAKYAMGNRDAWGENRLGKLLMEVRRILREEKSKEE